MAKKKISNMRKAKGESRRTAYFPAPRGACYPGHWVGRFIWDRGDSLPYNYYLMFRKILEAQDAPGSARIHITAAIKYKLWVNDSYVGSGPARSFPDCKSYDTHDISGLLKKGRNAIAVLTWFTGALNNYSSDERAGLWAQLECVDAAGRLRVVGTDDSWRIRQAKGFSRDVNNFRGIAPEIYDSRQDETGWTSAEFDDSSWENAACLLSGQYYATPTMQASWTYLEPREIPLMHEREVKAAALSYVGEADASFYPDITTITERMAGQELFPLQHARAEHLGSLIGAEQGPAILQNSGAALAASPPRNLLAGRTCHVFGPVDRGAPPPTAPDYLARVPERMVIADTTLEKQQGVCSSKGEIDLSAFIGGIKEGATAYVYLPFRIEEEGCWTIGVGADWWMECHLDGRKIVDTTTYGNRYHPPHYSNFRETVRLAKGDHLLVARVSGGALGCVFACGAFPAADSGSAVRDPFVTLDFGRMRNALPQIEFEAPAGAVIELAAGGDMAPDGRPTWGKSPDCDPNWRRSAAVIAAGGRQRWRVFEPIPVRFLQIIVRNAPSPVKLFDVKLVSWEYPAEPRGAFACSDDVLTKLWRAGVETAYLHMDDTVIFDPVRERACWTILGEVNQGHLAIAAGYGDLPFARAHISQTLRTQLPSGLFVLNQGSHVAANMGFPKPAAPSTVCNFLAMVNHMPFLAHTIRCWHWHFGSPAMVKEWYPALTRLADWFVKRADERGLLYNLPGQIWFDWVSDNELRGANFESNAIYCAMLNCLGEMAAWLNLPEEAGQWRQRATGVRDSLRASHWNEERGLFADSVIDGVQSKAFTELANGMALLYDIADEKQKNRIVESLSRNRNGCTQVTILYFYYFLEGLIRAGAGDYSLRRLSENNRRMMELSDPPSFWEEWPDFKTTHRAGNSPFHFGGTGVVWTMSTRVLGVEASAPGFSACRIRPICGHLIWAKGVVPSVRGDIQVEWRRDGERFDLSVVLPDGLPTEIVLPCQPGKTCFLEHNGRRHIQGGSEDAGVAWSEDAVSVQVNGGVHVLSLMTSS